MRIIWKYELEVRDYQVFEFPEFATPLFVAEQFGKLCMWVEVPDTSAPLVKRRVHIFGTGQPIPPEDDDFDYVGSALMMGGALVWHVYYEVVVRR